MTENIIVGQWAVFNDAPSYFDPRYEAREILKVTEKMVTTTSVYGNGPWRRNKSDLLWAGSEDEAKLLMERLNSSVGLMKDEVRRSKERMIARNDALLKTKEPAQ